MMSLAFWRAYLVLLNTTGLEHTWIYGEGEEREWERERRGERERERKRERERSEIKLGGNTYFVPISSHC